MAPVRPGSPSGGTAREVGVKAGAGGGVVFCLGFWKGKTGGKWKKVEEVWKSFGDFCCQLIQVVGVVPLQSGKKWSNWSNLLPKLLILVQET